MKRYFFLLFTALLGLSMNAAEYKKEIYVNPNGKGDFTSIVASLEAIRAYMDYEVTVHIANGVYNEKVIVPSWLKNVRFIGEDRDKTIIRCNDYAGRDNMGTFRTYTVRVDGDDISFENLTIENFAGPIGQAVALHTEGDRLVFVNCRFLGNQDTVFTGGEHTRLYFDKCYIEGTTDFIFGAATAVFKDCEIYCKSDSYITAASTTEDTEYGYIFDNCTINASDKVTKMYLGRPWRPYGYTAFIDCKMEAPIRAEGWHNWNNPDNEKTARYGEYGSKGTYGETNGRVAWAKKLTDKEVNDCRDLRKVFQGWKPLK